MNWYSFHPSLASISLRCAEARVVTLAETDGFHMLCTISIDCNALCNANHRSTRACSYRTETFVGNQQTGLPKHSNGICHRSMAWAAPRLGSCRFRGNGAEVGNSTWWQESQLGRPSTWSCKSNFCTGGDCLVDGLRSIMRCQTRARAHE